MKIVHLKPGGSFRNELHSDTLFGLICWAVRQVFSEERLAGLLERFAGGDPPFLISSAFPYREEEGGIAHFLPRPLLAPAQIEDAPSPEEAQRRKRFRKLSWIPAEDFSAFLKGERSEEEYYASGAWEGIDPDVRMQVDRLRTRIDRLSGTTDQSGALFTAPEQWMRGGGLYFLLEGAETEVVERSLAFLEDFGWGGGNSIGHGRFRAQVEEAELFERVEAPDRFVTLSLYHPRAEEVDHFREGDAWYELVVRKGKVGGHFLWTGDFWKRSVAMFAPGSTFPVLPGRRVYGDNPIVKGREDGLPFDVQQYGYAFAAGMKSKGA